MNSERAFSYTYSAACNQEVLNIRKKYLPQEESKLQELKRLDNLVQSSGVMEALIVGIGGCLIFGLGLCLAMKVIGNAMWLGIVLGVLGTAAMVTAYPAYRQIFGKTKAQYRPRILELTAELTGES